MGLIGKDNDELEGRLRRLGDEPRPDFVRELAGHVRETRRRMPTATRRVASALVAVVVMAVPFAAFGGIGLAANAAKSAVQAVTAVPAVPKVPAPPAAPAPPPLPAAVTALGKKPDDDQYSNGKKCGQPDGGPKKPNQQPCPPSSPAGGGKNK